MSAIQWNGSKKELLHLIGNKNIGVKMKVFYEPNRGWSTIEYLYSTEIPSLTEIEKEDYCLGGITMKSDHRRIVPVRITVDLINEYWRMGLAHEIGHILLGWRTNKKHTIKHIRCELLAWRIAKSILKKEYWNERWAIDCLDVYLDNTIPGKYDLSKIKFMPWDGEFKKKLKD